MQNPITSDISASVDALRTTGNWTDSELLYEVCRVIPRTIKSYIDHYLVTTKYIRCANSIVTGIASDDSIAYTYPGSIGYPSNGTATYRTTVNTGTITVNYARGLLNGTATMNMIIAGDPAPQLVATEQYSGGIIVGISTYKIVEGAGIGQSVSGKYRNGNAIDIWKVAGIDKYLFSSSGVLIQTLS